MKKYLAISANRIKEDLTYREHFFTLIIMTAVYCVVLYFIWKAIYGTSETLNGMTFEQSYVSMVLTFAMLRVVSNGVEWDMCFGMIEGSIIVDMVRPLDYMWYQMSQSAGMAGTNTLVLALPGTLILYFMFPGQIHVGMNMLFFIPCLILSFMCQFFLCFTIGVITIYTESVWGISTILDIISGFFAGSEVPLAFFPGWLLVAANVLPFKAMYNAPVKMLMDKTLGISDYMITTGVLALWTIGLYALSQVTYGVMKKKIVINGG